MSADVSVPNNFVAGAPSVADDVDANFASVVNWINTNAVHLDASKAFSAVPSGPATDPSSDNQLTRKAYVDARGSQGLVARVEKTSQQAGITTVVDVSGMSVTWSAVSTRRYRIAASCLLFSTVTSDIIQLQLTDSSNNVKAIAQVSAIASFGTSAALEWQVTGLSGSQTYKLRLVRGVGTGSITFDCGAAYPAYLYVEDIGTL